FRIGAERPITEVESAADEIDEGIKREQKLIANVAREREPLHILHDRVELMPVDDEHATSVRQTMNGMLLYGNVAIGAKKSGEAFRRGCPGCKRRACLCAICAKSFE